MNVLKFYCFLLVISNYAIFLYSQKFVVPNRWEHEVAVKGPRNSSYPYISGDTFRAIADFVIDETKIPFDPDKVTVGDIIFVSINHIDFFFNEVHQYIKVPYILITHNDDGAAPGKYRGYLEDKNIIAWFGQNSDIAYHSKFFPIPIGIHNSYWKVPGDITLYDKARAKIGTQTRDILLYLNFNDDTNKKERGFVRNLFKNQPWVRVESGRSCVQHLEDLSRSKFVLCPAGNGLDCHRTWEAMLMGAIPVLKHSTLDPLYEELPVILVDDWNEVTKEFLEVNYECISKKYYDKERIFAPYWLKKIKETQQLAKN